MDRGDDGAGQHIAQLLHRRAVVERHRESFVVVLPLPSCERRFGVRDGVEVVLAPELFAVNPVTAFDLPILLGPARFDVPMFDAGGFHGQLEGDRKLRPVVPCSEEVKTGQPLL